jgi:serine/threonine protein kinase
MDCGSLGDVYKTVGKIPESVLSEITFQVLQGLVYLKKKKIIHRDIKPSNVLLNKRGKAKISDFGMSKKLTTSITCFNSFKGTFHYMSPERIQGESHSFDSDIWSLGLTIAECCFGKLPFNPDTKQEDLWDILGWAQEFPEIMKQQDCSDEFKEFCTKCVEINPEDRPSPEELLEFKWIKMYNNSTTNESNLTEKWIEEVYKPAKKQMRLQKKLEKENMKQKGFNLTENEEENT